MSEGLDLFNSGLGLYIQALESQCEDFENRVVSLKNQNNILADELCRILFKDLPTAYISGIRKNFSDRITTIEYIRNTSKNSFLETLFGAVVFYDYLVRENFNE